MRPTQIRTAKNIAPEIGYYDTLGTMLWLMVNSDYHRQWPLWSIKEDILPPLVLGQYRVYQNENGNPVGFVTWAWLDKVGKDTILNQSGALSLESWKAGESLMINDFVAPWGHARMIINDLRSGIFACNKGFAVRRKPDGSIRKLISGHGSKFNAGR